MPQSPAQAPSILLNRMQYTVGTGPTTPPNVQTTASFNPPVDMPTQLLAVDAQPFSIALSGSGILSGTQIVTFPALPARDNLINPFAVVDASGTKISINAKDQLLFMAFIQDLSGPDGALFTASAASRAIQVPNTYVVGPFLGNGTFLTFQAVVTAQATNLGALTGSVAGIAVGVLYLAPG